jgi:uncharacterized protein (TIGR03083 family)
MAVKEELIRKLADSHQQIEQLVGQVDRNLEIYPGWTVREVLAHFSGWDEAAVDSLKSHAAGRTPAEAAGGDHDTYNLESIRRYESLDFERIYQMWQRNHEQLKIAIRDLPPEKMEEAFTFPWGQSGNVEDLVVGLTTDHETIHMKDVKNLIGKEE